MMIDECSFAEMVYCAGSMVTRILLVPTTVTVAVACWFGSATLCAQTRHEPAVTGAVYEPFASMDPGGSAENCTAVLDEPVTVALKAMISPGESVTDCGWIERVTRGAPSTVTTEVADFVGSAWALATTRSLPASLCATKRP